MSEYHKVNQMTEIQVAYFAGLLDGEGCVRIGSFKNASRQVRYRAHIVIAMTDSRPINWLAETVGGKVYVDKKLRHGNSKICFCWNINASEGAAILTRALPYLLVKREQAENVLTFFATLQRRNGAKPLAKNLLELRKELFFVSKNLNAKGVA